MSNDKNKLKVFQKVLKFLWGKFVSDKFGKNIVFLNKTPYL